MAATVIVMKLLGPGDKPIDGECEVECYEKRIVIEDWKWSLDGSADKPWPRPSTFSFSKEFDQSTVPMLNIMQSCEVCPTAELLLEDTSMDSYLRVKAIMKDIRILDYTMSAKLDEKSGDLAEDWVFSYKTIRFEYRSAGSASRENQDAKEVSAFFEADPHGMDSPTESAEDQILTLAAQLNPGSMKDLFRRMEAAAVAHAQRKIERMPADGKQQGKAR